MTGWTVKKKLSRTDNICSVTNKHHSMQETLQIIEKYYLLNILKFISKVRMYFTLRQLAWDKILYFSSHQRLHVMRSDKIWFEQWLIGMTDGDGTFSI